MSAPHFCQVTADVDRSCKSAERGEVNAREHVEEGFNS